MTTSSLKRPQHPRSAYKFVFDALNHTQLKIHSRRAQEGEESHISGPELLEGIRKLALKQFGLMATTVFHQWGIDTTEDFGRLVFELIERGEMKKNETDCLSDFCGIYSFEEEFDRKYRINTSIAFED
ncbi:MAG: hypothetical protein HUJ26_14065 [Planctomycetaceae bacterium]|nr:hypothetical protein [Planctomycetaceae bacterium]